MGKEVQHRNYYKIRLDNHHHQQQQGRFRGMLNVLDYHNWDYVKKLSNKKHVRKNRFRCCVAPRTVSFNFVNVDEESEHEEETTTQDLVISNPILLFHSVSHLRLKDERFHRRFNKVQSFPAPKPVSLGTKLYRSSTMDHKMNEFWSFPKGEKLNIVTSDSHKCDKLVRFGGMMKDSTSKHGWKINPFKSFKKKIKRALQETQREEIKEVSINKTKQSRITRLSSLNESIDKYTRLFEGSYGKEASKLDAEERKVNVHIVKNSLRRRLSLPNYEALNSLLAEESQENLQSRQENLRSGYLAKTLSKDSFFVEMVDEEEEFIEDDSMIDFVEDSLYGSEIDIDRNAESLSIRGGNEGECASIDDHCDFEARNVEIVSKPMGELQPSSPDSVLVTFSPLQDSTTVTTNFDNLIESRYDPGKEDDPDFKFVRKILNSSGYSENDLIPTWDSTQPPRNATSYNELNVSEDQELIFDLTNEALLDIYNRSHSYFPIPFSFNPYTRPVSNGKHVIDEVWRIVKLYKDMKPELDVSLDNIVARDMARQDGWVNPCGLDNECVALVLEDLILNELVDELIDSLH